MPMFPATVGFANPMGADIRCALSEPFGPRPRPKIACQAGGAGRTFFRLLFGNAQSPLALIPSHVGFSVFQNYA